MKAGNLYPIAQEILSRMPAEDRQLIRLWHMGFKCTYLALLNHRTVESVRDVISGFLTEMSNSI